MIYHTKIQLLIVWACLPILICIQGNIIFNDSDEKLIIVNPLMSYDDVNRTTQDDGRTTMDCDARTCFRDSCTCSRERTCLCSEFEDAFNLVEDNTVIAINGTLQDFTAIIALNNITNIAIIGYNKVIAINCLARGSIEFNDCDNIIIENITWISCGNNSDLRFRSATVGDNGMDVITCCNNFNDNFLQLYFYGLSFTICTNISLKSCTFEASMVGIYEVSDVIYIDQVHFLSTSAYDLDNGISLATGLIINQTNTQANTSVVVKIVNSLFSQSECFNSCNSQNNLLLFYILVDDPDCTIHILVNQTNFSSASFNQLRMVWFG